MVGQTACTLRSWPIILQANMGQSGVPRGQGKAVPKPEPTMVAPMVVRGGPRERGRAPHRDKLACHLIPKIHLCGICTGLKLKNVKKEPVILQFLALRQ